MTSELKGRVEVEAKRLGIGVAAFIRSALLAALDRPQAPQPPADPQVNEAQATDLDDMLAGLPTIDEVLAGFHPPTDEELRAVMPTDDDLEGLRAT
jgi:hypothetical protein